MVFKILKKYFFASDFTFITIFFPRLLSIHVHEEILSYGTYLMYFFSPLCSYFFFLLVPTGHQNLQLIIIRVEFPLFSRKIIEKARRWFKLTKESLAVFLAYLLINIEIFIIKYLLQFSLNESVTLDNWKINSPLSNFFPL